MSTYQNPEKDVQLNVGLDSRLAYNRNGPTDNDFWSEVDSQFMPKPSMNCRNYTLEERDVQPAGLGSATVAFNTLVNIKYGASEGYPNLYAAQLYMIMPRLVDSGATNRHPQDALYAGTGTVLQWQPWLAELVYGRAEPATQRFSTEIMRKVAADTLHVKRELCHDSNGTSKRVAYSNSVGAVARSAVTETVFRLPLWLPHTTDEPNFHQILPVQAFATEFTCTLKVPRLLELIQSDVTPANIIPDPAASIPFPQIFARLYYVVTEKAERGNFANMVLSDTGLVYQVMQASKEVAVTTATTTAHTVTQVIRTGQNPTAFIAVIVRYIDDLKAVGDAAQINDTNVPPRAVGGFIQRPRYMNFQPWNWIELRDGGNRVVSRLTMDEWQNCTIKGISNRFPCDLNTNIAVITFTAWPTVENHGLGHCTPTTLNSPTIAVNLPAVASTETGASRQVDIIYFERNWVHMANGTIIRVYQVLDGY